jgi:5'-nucleotidase
MTLRALVTNDDGIGSEGIRHLAMAAVASGLEVTVAAPRDEKSGSSAALTAVQDDGHIAMEEHRLQGLDGIPACGVAATPGFIALIASRGAFGPPPDVVLSGINRGANTGHAILHSGTVGATLTAHTQGCRGLAVSLASANPVHWETAAALAKEAIRLLLAGDRPLVLNLNVPDVPITELRGLRRARLASFGVVQTAITEVGKGPVKVGVTDAGAELEAGTDSALIAAGFATITPLDPICETRDVDLPGVIEVQSGELR